MENRRAIGPHRICKANQAMPARQCKHSTRMRKVRNAPPLRKSQITTSMGRFLSVPAILVLVVAAVMFVELLRAVLAFEFMAFAGDAQDRDGDDKQGKKFHRALLSRLIGKRNPQRGWMCRIHGKTIAISRGSGLIFPRIPLKRSRHELGTTLPSLGWLAVFMLLPSVLVLVTAFRPTDPSGGIDEGWTLDQFRIFATPAMQEVLWRTVWISGLTTGLCLLLALPVAWFMARVSPVWRARLLLMVIVPFWTNFLIRVFAWNQILHSEGWLARSLRALHLLGDNESLLFSSGAVVLVSVYTYLPFAILPLYAAAEKFDFGLLDAARDLGADAFRAFVSVFIPGIRKGISTALVIVFVPMLGSYVVPDLVGGTDGQMIGNRIAQRNFSDRDFPSASAMSAVLTLAVLLPVLFRRRENKGEPS